MTKAQQLGQLLIKALSIKNLNIERVFALIEDGADLEARNEYDATPLIIATDTGSKKIVEALLNAGSNVNAASGIYATALHRACLHDDKEITQLLVKNGADMNAPDNQGDNTPLMLACMFGKRHAASVLIEHGANLDMQNVLGQTALMICCEILSFNSDLRTATAIVNRGANLRLKDAKGKTVLDLTNNETLRQLILKKFGENLIDTARNGLRQPIILPRRSKS